jgi:hypothetical protein
MGPSDSTITSPERPQRCAFSLTPYPALWLQAQVVFVTSSQFDGKDAAPSRVVHTVTVLICHNPDAIARLEFTHLCRTTGGADVFGRIPTCKVGNRSIVGLDDECVVRDFPQHPGKGCGLGFVALAAARIRLTALRVAAARISATGGTTARNHNLTVNGNTSHQQKRNA